LRPISTRKEKSTNDSTNPKRSIWENSLLRKGVSGEVEKKKKKEGGIRPGSLGRGGGGVKNNLSKTGNSKEGP